MIRQPKRRGLSLMEVCVTASLLAIFAAAFASMSVRLASAQSQQSHRLRALSLLDSEIQARRVEGPRNWHGPWLRRYQEEGASYTVFLREVPQDATDRSFGVLQGEVRWRDASGDKIMTREVWLHESLD